MRSAAPLLALALLLPFAPTTAAGMVEARWEYVLSVPDPGSGNVHVDLTISGVSGAVTRFTFATEGHRDEVTNVVGGPDTPIKREESGISFEVDGVESFSYDVRVERPAFVEGQLLGHAGTDFALFKAESVALEYRYSYFEGTTFRNLTTVRLAPPAGWDAEGPWRKLEDGTYALPEGHVLPRGYVVFGKFLAREDRVAGDKVVRYVRLGDVAEFEENGALYDYIAKATPYYAAVYGPGVEKDVLVVSAPDPMFRGGLGGANSFFVHESADLRTVAHEYAHVFQLFGTEETLGRSAIWLNEGDADYHSALSLFAADLWSPDEVNEFLAEAAEDAKDPQLAGARLPDAAYGTSLERFAYHKGALVLRALDVLLHERTGGDVTLSDFIRDINARHGDPSKPEAAQHVTNEEVRETAERLLGSDLGEFFSRYALGSEWPLPITPFIPEGQLVVSELRVEPARVAPGEQMTATVEIVNRGTSSVIRFIDVHLDGKRIASREVSLDVGASATLEFPLAAPEPGEHEIRVLYERATIHSLTPANVTIARTSLVPATPRAGEPVRLLTFLENGGEQPGTARVEVRRAGNLLSGTTETIVDGLGEAVLTLPLQFAAPGNVTLTLALLTPQGETFREMVVAVQPADRDADGVGDAEDAYPDDPRLFEKSLGNDVKAVPMPVLATLLALVLVALVRRPA